MNRRFTKQRGLILETLRANPVHPTADELYSMLKESHPDLSLGTVYRNLNVLCEQGEIRKIDGGFASSRFDGNNEPHYHFVCQDCDELMDVDIAYLKEPDRLVEEICGHAILFHDIIFSGVCRDCLKSRSLSLAK